MTDAGAHQVLLRLRCPSASSAAARPSLSLALFDGGARLGPAEARLSRARSLSNDGVYAYPPGGVCIARSSLPAGSYVCIPSALRACRVARKPCCESPLASWMAGGQGSGLLAAGRAEAAVLRFVRCAGDETQAPSIRSSAASSSWYTLPRVQCK